MGTEEDYDEKSSGCESCGRHISCSYTPQKGFLCDDCLDGEDVFPEGPDCFGMTP